MDPEAERQAGKSARKPREIVSAGTQQHAAPPGSP
jgi:hypothetical protein